MSTRKLAAAMKESRRRAESLARMLAWRVLDGWPLDDLRREAQKFDEENERTSRLTLKWLRGSNAEMEIEATCR